MSTGWDINTALAAILLAFGIIVPVPTFSAGMLLALGFCFGVRSMRPLERRKGVGLSLFYAVLAATVVAAANESTSGIWLWGSAGLQLQMAAAGALSQAIFELIAARGGDALGKVLDKVGVGERK